MTWGFIFSSGSWSRQYVTLRIDRVYCLLLLFKIYITQPPQFCFLMTSKMRKCFECLFLVQGHIILSVRWRYRLNFLSIAVSQDSHDAAFTILFPADFWKQKMTWRPIFSSGAGSNIISHKKLVTPTIFFFTVLSLETAVTYYSLLEITTHLVTNG